MAAQPQASEDESYQWTPEGVLGVIRHMVLLPEYPCLGARSVVRTGGVTVGLFEDLGSSDSARELLPQLTAFARPDRRLRLVRGGLPRTGHPQPATLRTVALAPAAARPRPRRPT